MQFSHGPRQCGKTTLARLVGDPLGYSYFSFDDPVLISAAESDPIGFIDDLPNRTKNTCRCFQD